MDSRFSLRWNNYASQITDAFGSLLLEEDLVDVTLSCEGKKIKAHKMLLSACSPYFHDIFKENPCQHPVIVFRNVQFIDLKAIVEFIYCGEVNVLQEQLETFLNTAGLLEVKGLTDKENESGTEEMSGMIATDEENTQTDQVRKQRINTTKKQVSRLSTTSGLSSPPAKKRKSNVDKLPDEVSAPTEVATVIKEEVEEIDVVDEDVADLEVSEPFSLEVSTLRPKISLQGSDAETSKEIAEVLEEPSTKEVTEEKIECIDVDLTVEDESSALKRTSPDIKPVESKTAVPLKKRKNIPEEEISSEGEIQVKSEKKTPEVEPAAPVAKAAPPKTTVKGKVLIPKGLVVTSIKAASQVEDLFDFPTHEPQVQDEDYTALRSEEATTPVHEDPIAYAQDTLAYEDVPPGQNAEVEPEIAEEAPVLQEQTEPEEPVEEEPEFDYFGCEICRSEAKPVDLERITFSHKCPICPCCCFCAHLLKEHMKVIHGWFNVQRRYTQY